VNARRRGVGAKSPVPSALAVEPIHRTAAFFGGPCAPDSRDRPMTVGTFEYVKVDVGMFQFQSCTSVEEQ
jgi:hypothetical protein